MSDQRPPPKPMTSAEREARKAFKEVDVTKALSEHQIEDKAFFENRERLKAERLAREEKAATDRRLVEIGLKAGSK